MLLRRMTQHVRNQNWLAVGLDFAIVVTGVLLAMQFTNSNTARQDEIAYKAALDRLAVELRENRESASRYFDYFAPRLSVVEQGLNVLLSCQGGAENVAKVETAVEVAMVTPSKTFKLDAIDALTSQSRLIGRQSPEMKSLLSDISRKSHSTDDFIERVASEMEQLWYIPLTTLEVGKVDRSELLKLPKLDVRSREEMDFSEFFREYQLRVPLSDACQDSVLTHRLVTWENVTAFNLVSSERYRALAEGWLTDLGYPLGAEGTP